MRVWRGWAINPPVPIVPFRLIPNAGFPACLYEDVTLKHLLLATAAALILPKMAGAHFLLSYTKDTIIERPGDVPVKLAFWHPMSDGTVMELAEPLEFYMVHRGEKTDLKSALTPTVFRSSENSAGAYMGSVPVKRSGDYVLVTVPQPYFEESEDKFIQQITKAYLNRSGLPTDWDQPQNLRAEILPLTKPYNIIAGSTFRGRVMAAGEPVAGAEIEVEFMAAEPDMEGEGALGATAKPLPGGAIVVISDDAGYFDFGVPKAGYWGFAALDIGPDKEFQGKHLSQDAVIWVRAWDLN